MQNEALWWQLTLRQKFTGWLVVMVSALYFFYEFIQMNMFNSLAFPLEQTFKLSAFQIGLISAFYFLSDSVLLYPVGAILDRYSPKKMILLGMLMCIGGTLLIASASNPWFLVGARFLSGIASAFCLLSILRLATHWFAAIKMGQVSGAVITLGMLGGAVSQAPLTWLIQITSWRMALVWVAALGALIFILMCFVVKEPPAHTAFFDYKKHPAKAHPLQDLKILIRNQHNWLIGFYICTMNLPIMILAGLFGTDFMREGYGFSTLEGSSISMMIFIGTIVGSTFFGFLSDLLKCRRLPMLYTAVISFALFLLILYGPFFSYHGMLILFFALGFFTGAQIIGYAVTHELNLRHLTGSALGFISVIIMGLPALLQPLTGLLMQHSGHTIYTLTDYRRGLMVLVVGFGISIISAYFLPESYGVRLDNPAD